MILDHRNKSQYRTSRRSIWDADPPRSVAEIVNEAIPQRGLLAIQVANLVIPYEDCLWILLHACGLEDRKCRVFARICALRSLRLWTSPYPESVANFLRIGRRMMIPEARAEMLQMMRRSDGERALKFTGGAESAARWATVLPLIDFDRIDLKMGKWAGAKPAARAVAAAKEARKAGISAPSQIMDLLAVMHAHPSVLAHHMAIGAFESTGEEPPKAKGTAKVYGAKSASDHHVDCCFRCRRGTPCKEGIRLRGIAEQQEISRKTAAG